MKRPIKKSIEGVLLLSIILLIAALLFQNVIPKVRYVAARLLRPKASAAENVNYICGLFQLRLDKTPCSDNGNGYYYEGVEKLLESKFVNTHATHDEVMSYFGSMESTWYSSCIQKRTDYGVGVCPTIDESCNIKDVTCSFRFPNSTTYIIVEFTSDGFVDDIYIQPVDS